MPPHRTYRIRPALEVFPAGDGDVYLLGGQTVAEFVIEDADHTHLTLLGLLEKPRSHDELASELARLGRPMTARALAEALEKLDAIGVLDEEEPAGDRDLLSGEERARYDRQLAYFTDMRPGRASRLQAALRDATVAIVGVGGLGTWAAAGLASSGVGHLRLVDDDTVDLSNLNRQVLYRRCDVGRPKVEVAAEALGAFDPQLRLTTVATRVDGPERASAVSEGADFVIETADWPPQELSRWLDAACWPRGVPRIVAAQFPPRVRIGPTYVPGRTGCLRCQEREIRREWPLYDRLIALRATKHKVAPTLGPASGIIGTAIAMEVVHHLTGIAPPATLGTGLTLDLRDWSIERETVPRVAGCDRCG